MKPLRSINRTAANRRWRWAIRGLVTLTLVFALFAAGCWIVGGALVAPAARNVGPAPEDLPAEVVHFESESGSRIAGWHIPGDGAAATVILLHPIRGDRRSMLSRARLLRAHGFSTLLIDLQAHGESPGEQITVGYLERHDVRAAVSWVRSRNPDHKIGVIGRSLGGAAALFASPLDVDAVVLESVYPTITEAVRNRVAKRVGPLHHVLTPALLWQLEPRLGVSADQLRPIDHIADVGAPLIIASGDQDEHTAEAETQRLYDAAIAPKELVLFSGAEHVDLLQHDSVLYESRIVGFLIQELRSPRPGGALATPRSTAPETTSSPE